MSKQIYLGGDLLNHGSQLQRAEEKVALLDLGHALYVPQDNKAINDKATLSNEGLAERIVKHDTDGINSADAVVMEVREGALGTCIEMGQIKGQRDFAKAIMGIILEYQGMGLDPTENIQDICNDELDRPIYIHNSDIRLQGKPASTIERCAYGPHQYMYGVVLDVTDGRGYQQFNEILEDLKESEVSDGIC